MKWEYVTVLYVWEINPRCLYLEASTNERRLFFDGFLFYYFVEFIGFMLNLGVYVRRSEITIVMGVESWNLPKS